MPRGPAREADRACLVHKSRFSNSESQRLTDLHQESLVQKRTSCHVDAYAGREKPRCRAVSMSCDVRSTYVALSPASLRVWTPLHWLGMEAHGCHVGIRTAHGSHVGVPRARFPPPSWLGMEARGPDFGVRRAVRSPHDEAQMLKCKNGVFPPKNAVPGVPGAFPAPFYRFQVARPICQIARFAEAKRTKSN